MTLSEFNNPFKPGAGHMPPYLAGRVFEMQGFLKLLEQKTILDNLILTGLRGVGKTVLLESFKPHAIRKGWLWTGTDLSESVSMTEERLATRVITDLSMVTSNVPIKISEHQAPGFGKNTRKEVITLNFNYLMGVFSSTPGLAPDKLKAVLRAAWKYLQPFDKKGLIFAYDEAQNLADRASRDEFPLALLLDTFQAIQREHIPFMLLLTGLPTLSPKLVESRTYSERMFSIMFLNKLKDADSRDAILKPISGDNCPLMLEEESVAEIVRISGGYPYFIQFICREVFDVIIQNVGVNEAPDVPVDAIIRKLDTDFFTGRWVRLTDRQRQLLMVIARLDTASTEFSVQEIVDLSKTVGGKPFSNSHVNQMLVSLFKAGLVYKNRHGKYSFAVPLMDQFILRQISE